MTISRLDKYIETNYDNIFKITTIMNPDFEVFIDTYRCNTTTGSWNLSRIDFAYTLTDLMKGLVETQFKCVCEEKGINPKLMKIMRRRIPINAIKNENFKNELVPSYFINVREDKSE